jgi:8-oxo-dGTP pyrophosphatase MutT (NUDIX family)|tara:strand:+ start:933 stop:1202 length:270 start_codon:yes stop_codon:yes gene_type:complete
VRELKEETGISKFEFLDFKEKLSYFYKKGGGTVFKEVSFFLITTNIKEVKVSEEHKSYKWCDYKEAHELVKFKNTREILKKAKIMVENI